MNLIPLQRMFARRRSFRTPRTYNPRLIISSTIGVLVFAGTLTGMIILTSRFISSLRVSSSRAYWSNLARTDVYELCYDGCDDCLDVSTIYNACKLTASVQSSVPDDVTCNALDIWYWDDEARFPSECLDAVGIKLKEDALKRKRFWWKALYLLCPIVAIGLGWVVYSVLFWWLQRFESLDSRPWTGFKKRSVSHHNGGSGRSSSRSPLLAATIIAFLMIPPQVSAYACIRDPAHDQLFANPANTIYGVIHGWLSNCYTSSSSCGETCTYTTTTYAGRPSSERDCQTRYCDEPVSDRRPREYVNEAWKLVGPCGFRRVDYVPGVVDRRIPNPRIEGRLWVKISVGRFNTTLEGGEENGVLDEQIKCLYGIVDPPRW